MSGLDHAGKFKPRDKENSTSTPKPTAAVRKGVRWPPRPTFCCATQDEWTASRLRPIRRLPALWLDHVGI